MTQDMKSKINITEIRSKTNSNKILYNLNKNITKWIKLIKNTMNFNKILILWIKHMAIKELIINNNNLLSQKNTTK